MENENNNSKEIIIEGRSMINTLGKRTTISDKNKVDTQNNKSTINVNEYYQEFLDMTPHITDSLDNNSLSNDDGNLASSSFANHPDGGAQNFLTTFQKYRQGYYEGVDPTLKGIQHIFITKPNLNLATNTEFFNDASFKDKIKDKLTGERLEKTIQNIKASSFITWIAKNYPDLITSLRYTSSILNSASNIPNFIPLLSNHFKSVNIDDLSFMDTTLYETYRGFNQKLPTTSAQSSAGGSISVSYEEISPPLITYLHKVWFDYIELVKFGYILPDEVSIKNKEIDYASSLYLFSLDPDGETINFWCRYTGIIPSNVPYSSFAGSVGQMEKVEVSISYMYSHKEFLDPDILMDFNDIFGGKEVLSKYSAIGDYEIDKMNDEDFKNKLIEQENPHGIPVSKILGTDYQKDYFTITSPLKNPGKYKYLEKNGYKNAGIINQNGKFKLIFY